MNLEQDFSLFEIKFIRDIRISEENLLPLGSQISLLISLSKAINFFLHRWCLLKLKLKTHSFYTN